MDPKLLDSILTIKARLGHEQICSTQYSLPPEVLNLISKSFLTLTPENLYQNNEEGQEYLDFINIYLLEFEFFSIFIEE